MQAQQRRIHFFNLINLQIANFCSCLHLLSQRTFPNVSVSTVAVTGTWDWQGGVR